MLGGRAVLRVAEEERAGVALLLVVQPRSVPDGSLVRRDDVDLAAGGLGDDGGDDDVRDGGGGAGRVDDVREDDGGGGHEGGRGGEGGNEGSELHTCERTEWGPGGRDGELDVGLRGASRRTGGCRGRERTQEPRVRARLAYIRRKWRQKIWGEPFRSR